MVTYFMILKYFGKFLTLLSEIVKSIIIGFQCLDKFLIVAELLLELSYAWDDLTEAFK